MEIRPGQFGRFWNGARPPYLNEYEHGYLMRFDKEPGERSPYMTVFGFWFERFEPAIQEPQFQSRTKRVLIRDKHQLVEQLLIEGYEPAANGNWYRGKQDILFCADLFGHCGEPVKETGIFAGCEYILRHAPIRESWTEEVEDD